MPKNWNKGQTKETNISVRKISETMKRKNIDNFYKWREIQYKLGNIKRDFKDLKKSKQLAELIGVVWGDGNIEKFPRTERLVISGDNAKYSFIDRYSQMVEKIFDKKPTVMKSNQTNAVRISIYQNKISERLKVPTGSKFHLKIMLHKWIKQDKLYLTYFLKGLYEADGSLSHHKKTYTYNFCFSNVNQSLLDVVEDALIKFGFHPERRINSVRLRRKLEVEKFAEMIKFRQY